MDDARYEKLAAATGIPFVVLTLGSAFVVPNTPPKIDDPIQKVGRFFGEHHSGLIWAGWLGIIGALFGLWFIGTVAHWVRRQGQPRLATIAFAGGVVGTAVATVGGLLSTGLAYLATAPDDIGAPVARALFDLGNLAFVFLWIPIAVLVAAVSMAAQRTNALPQWLWTGGAIYAVIAVVASTGMFAHSGAFAPGGFIQLIVFLLFAVWALSLSIVLSRKAGMAATSAAAPVPTT
ncbi:MAG: hypothetical protein ABR600_01080 [Actinomycetota bacterium]